MARNTIFEVPDSFFDVFAPDLVRSVLMATVTGIARVITVFVIRRAFHVVVMHKVIYSMRREMSARSR